MSSKSIGLESLITLDEDDMKLSIDALTNTKSFSGKHDIIITITDSLGGHSNLFITLDFTEADKENKTIDF